MAVAAVKNAIEEKKARNPFVPNPLDALDKGLIEVRKLKAGQGTCKFGYIGKDGAFALSYNTACHAGLSIPEIEEPEYVVNYLTSSRQAINPSAETRRAFTEWLVNFSPFRTVFVEHDIDTIMKDEFVIASTDRPQNLMAAALQATRAMSEHPQASVIWHELVKNGLHPNLAFYTGYVFSTDGKVLYSHRAGHTGVFEGQMYTRTLLVNFLNDTPVKLEKETYKQRHSYSGACKLFSGKDMDYYGKNGDDIAEAVAAKIGKAMVAGPVGAKVNPFAKAPVANNKWEFKKACAVLAEILKEEFKTELEKLRG